MMLAFGAVLAVLSVLPALLGLAGIDFGSRTVPPAELLAEAVVEGEHHLVFMDCNMPGLSGFDATRLIRVRESGKEYRTIVIAMTANARASTREHCLEAGMDDYITKPVRAGVLAEVLDR
ncbi:MAG: response regulator, partial [Planctomycetota bacterium]